MSLQEPTPTTRAMWREPEPPARRVLYAFNVRDAVAAHYGLTIEEIAGNCREPRLVKPRHIAMYLMMRLTGAGSPRVGKLMGDRDHSSVLYGARTARGRVAADATFAAEVAVIEAKIEGAR